MPGTLLFRVFALAAILVALWGSSGLAQDEAIDSGWAKFRERFVTPEGRVLDTGNNAVSHTEGQGFALLFAEAADDRDHFDLIWNWTRENLQRHDISLFSWRWNPADGKTPVADRNDASDGDILIAWALLRAARHWHEPAYAHQAVRVIADIRRRLLVSASGRLVLLPGTAGFKSKDGVTIVNPSYYIYPALNDFARVFPSREWSRVRRDGLDLLAEARFGRWGLTPDWIDLDHHGAIEPAAKFPSRFGFDAIRIPLYLIWGGEATPARLASYLDFWNDFAGKPIPAWTDVKDNSLAPYPGSTGFSAVIQLARGFGQANPPALPSFGDKDDYYSASLSLLAMIAQRETATASDPKPEQVSRTGD